MAHNPPLAKTSKDKLVEARFRELIAINPYNDELAAEGISPQQWEIYLRATAESEVHPLPFADKRYLLEMYDNR